MENLTPHFTDVELGVAGTSSQLISNATFLCSQVLEPLRAKFGPIIVDDGYRDPDHNSRVGGKPASFHLFEDGKAAADVRSPRTPNETMFDWLRLESKLPFDKIILERDPQGYAACRMAQGACWGLMRVRATREDRPTGRAPATRFYWCSDDRARAD